MNISKQDKLIKICPVCQHAFKDKKHPRKIYCSRKCAGYIKRVPIKTHKCLTCGTIINGKNKYCSKQCAKSSYGWKAGKTFTAVTKTCVICGNQFKTVPSSSKQKCCSIKCAALSRRKPTVNKQRICLTCKTAFKVNKPKQKFCSKKCSAQYRASKTIKKIKPNDVRPRNTMLACERCGFDKYKKILERHHKDRNRNNNNYNNIEILCPNCHDIEHYLKHDGRFRVRY